MATDTLNIGRLYGMLGEREKSIIAELICRLLPDDVATPADLEAIAKSQAEYERGEAVLMEDVDWD